MDKYIVIITDHVITRHTAAKLAKYCNYKHRYLVMASGSMEEIEDLAETLNGK